MFLDVLKLAEEYLFYFMMYIFNSKASLFVQHHSYKRSFTGAYKLR